MSDTFYVEKDPKKIHQMIHSAARQLLLNIKEAGVDVSYSTCLDDVTLYYAGMSYGDFSRQHSDVILGENNKGGHNEALS